MKQFVEYVPDVNKAELLKKESNKVEVMTPDGKKFVSMTTFILQPKGKQVLARTARRSARSHSSCRRPPLLPEHGEDGDDEGGDGECGGEPEPEEEEVVEEEEEFAEGQQFLEKANGETVYVPLVIFDEKIRRTADGRASRASTTSRGTTPRRSASPCAASARAGTADRGSTQRRSTPRTARASTRW